MDLGQLSSRLGEAIRNTPAKGRVSAYLFGSVLTSTARADDLGLLILYSEIGDCSALREAIHEVVLPLPVDLALMTEEEEKHYDFLNVVQASGSHDRGQRETIIPW